MEFDEPTLFDNEPDWQAHWRDMPEFVQEDKESWARVVVHFETEQDMALFAERIGIAITPKTKGIYYPPKPKVAKIWIDEP